MPSAYFSRILAIIVEIFVRQQPIFVADQTVGLDSLWIEIDLNLDVFGNRDQSRPHLLHEAFLRL